MTTIYLIRHAEAAATIGDTDPDLSEHGSTQAHQLAATFCASHAPMPVICSPLKRALATATIISTAWEQSPHSDPRFVELPCPVAENRRRDWLRGVMRGEWNEQTRKLQHWRSQAIDALEALEQDTIIVTHFVLINALVGWVQQRNEVVIFEPGNGSRKEITRADDGRYTVTTPSRD